MDIEHLIVYLARYGRMELTTLLNIDHNLLVKLAANLSDMLAIEFPDRRPPQGWSWIDGKLMTTEPGRRVYIEDGRLISEEAVEGEWRPVAPPVAVAMECLHRWYGHKTPSKAPSIEMRW